MRFLDGSPLEYTFALIKPDAVLANKATDILDDMGKLWIISDVLMTQWSRELVGRFYAEHVEKDFFNGLVDFMTSAPMYAVTLVGPNVVQRWREEMGTTDPLKAGLSTFRGRYAAKDGVVMHNVVHGSDSKMNAEREIYLVHRHLFSDFGNGIHQAMRRYAGAKWSTRVRGVEYPSVASGK